MLQELIQSDCDGFDFHINISPDVCSKTFIFYYNVMSEKKQYKNQVPISLN